MDAIYTPPDLAQVLIEATTLSRPESIADFAAGDGALLRAAAARWPLANLFGSDVNAEAVFAIKTHLPACAVANHDFLAVEGDGLLTGRSFDLIVLNPPFSCRGGVRHRTQIELVNHSASKALVFFAHATKFLRVGGELVAILPASILFSERDAQLLSALKSWGRVEQIGEVRRAAFKSHAVSVTILRISKRNDREVIRKKPLLVALKPFAVEITRGSASAREGGIAQAGPPLIHTTNLQGGRILSTNERAASSSRSFRGPAVLISRVGRPSRDKIVLLPSCEVVLSNCVIAFRTAPTERECELLTLLSENWDTFRLAYGGTCAPYTTLKRLSEVLLRLGVRSSVLQAARRLHPPTSERNSLHTVREQSATWG